MLIKQLTQLFPLGGAAVSANGAAYKQAFGTVVNKGFISLAQIQSRTLTTKNLTNSLSLMTNATMHVQTQPGKPLQLLFPPRQSEERPLSVLLCWLMSEKKHIVKYAQFYLDQGFDVLTVRVNPFQLLFPVTGSQVVARDLVTFMAENRLYKTMMIHGFSVGGYLWGEALNIMGQDLPKYGPIMKQISGQIWDSVVDFEGIPTGMPKAVFPKNALLRNTLEGYIKLHMSAFKQIATQHYLRSSYCFHNPIVEAPALFLCSLDDPVGDASGIRVVADKWGKKGMKVYLKAWDSSPHVSHLHHHPEEYNQEMKTFLEMLGLVSNPEKFLLKAVSRG